LSRFDALEDTVDQLINGSLLTPSAATISNPSATPSGLICNGLMVVAYASFEDFITQCAIERLTTLNPQQILLADLPARLRKEMSYGAFLNLASSLKYLAKSLDEPDLVDFVARESHILGSQVSAAYGFSKHTFRAAGTNLSVDDMSKFLRTVCVKDQWGAISDVARRMGFGSPGLRDAVKNDGQNRNSAAHDPAFSMSLPDLRTTLQRLRAVAAAFETVFNSALAHIERGPCPPGCQAGSPSNLKVLRIEQQASSYGIYMEGSNRAKKRCKTMTDAMYEADALLSRRQGVVMIHDGRGMAVDWSVPAR
jgi:hypothetical protein